MWIPYFDQCADKLALLYARMRKHILDLNFVLWNCFSRVQVLGNKARNRSYTLNRTLFATHKFWHRPTQSLPTYLDRKGFVDLTEPARVPCCGTGAIQLSNPSSPKCQHMGRHKVEHLEPIKMADIPLPIVFSIKSTSAKGKINSPPKTSGAMISRVWDPIWKRDKNTRLNNWWHI